MRIGACLLLKDGYCYQSYRWQYLRPLGSLQNAINILEERQVDEIAIIRYCRHQDDQNSFVKDLDLVSQLDCITPLAFGGGIRDSKALNSLHQLPIERLLLSSAYIEKNTDLIEEGIKLFGKQAMIAVLPYRVVNTNIEYYHCRNQKFGGCDLSYINSHSNEVMLYDTDCEGLAYRGLTSIGDKFPFHPSKIILSGGVSFDTIAKYRKLDFASVCIDNSALHTEFNFNQL